MTPVLIIFPHFLTTTADKHQLYHSLPLPLLSFFFVFYFDAQKIYGYEAASSELTLVKKGETLDDTVKFFS
jgi:hypothetical protein